MTLADELELLLGELERVRGLVVAESGDRPSQAMSATVDLKWAGVRIERAMVHLYPERKRRPAE